MIVTLNTLASINFVTGTWQMQFALIVTGFYIYGAHARYLNWTKFETHYIIEAVQIANMASFFDSICKILINIQNHDRSILMKLLIIMSMLLQVFSLGKIGFTAYIIRSLDRPLEKEHLHAIYIWCFLVMSTYVAITASNSVFLLIRSCCKHKILLEQHTPKHKRLVDNDTIIELRVITESYKNDIFMVIFLFCEAWIWFKLPAVPDFENIPICFYFKVIFILNTLLISNWQVFYRWNKSDRTVKMFMWGYYIKCFIQPVISVIVITGFFWSSVKLWESLFFSFNIIYVVMIASDIPGYFITIRPYIKNLRKIRKKRKYVAYLRTVQQDLCENKDAVRKIQREIDRIEAALNELTPNVSGPYLKQDRLIGEGSFRIGTSVELNKDLYCLSVISCLKECEILKYLDIGTGEEILDINDGIKFASNYEKIRLASLQKAQQQNLNQLKKVMDVEDQTLSQALKQEDSSIGDQELEKKIDNEKQSEDTQDSDGNESTEKQNLTELNEENVSRIAEIFAMNRSSVLQNTMLCWFIQVFLCALIIVQEVATNLSLFVEYESINFMVMARFFCSLILHMALMDEMKRAYDLMKYVINHSYRFEYIWFAYSTSFAQALMTTFVETVCIFVVCTAQAPMGIVYNFLSLAIIGDFDNYIFEAFKVPMSVLCEKRMEKEELFIIQHTTSSRCNESELSAVKYEGQDTYRPLKVTFASRSWQNKLGFIFYKFNRVIYLCFYFYFMPYIIFYIQWYFPQTHYVGEIYF